MRGTVKRAVTINALPDAVYDYLADTETLLTKVPYVERIQLRRKTGKARAFFRMMVLGYDLTALFDAEPTYDPQTRVIRLAPPATPFGVVAFDMMHGFFRCAKKFVPTQDNPRASRVTAAISLALDVSSNDLLSYFPRPLFGRCGRGALSAADRKPVRRIHRALARRLPALLHRMEAGACSQLINQLMLEV